MFAHSLTDLQYYIIMIGGGKFIFNFWDSFAGRRLMVLRHTDLIFTPRQSILVCQPSVPWAQSPPWRLYTPKGYAWPSPRESYRPLKSGVKATRTTLHIAFMSPRVERETATLPSKMLFVDAFSRSLIMLLLICLYLIRGQFRNWGILRNYNITWIFHIIDGYMLIDCKTSRS